MREDRVRHAFLVLFVAGATVAFVVMIWPFFVTIVLAGVFASLAYPAYRRLVRLFRGRQALAAAATVALLFLLVMTPLLAALGAIANEALRVHDTIGPRLQQYIDHPLDLERKVRALPGLNRLAPYRGLILTKVQELIGSLGSRIFDTLSETTRATGVFVFQFFILLYTMFFFLTGGPTLLQTVLSYLPLTGPERERMADKFVAVTRATLKSTLVVGVTQGTLNGLAFWAVGFNGALFWGAMMAILSIVPGIGAALIWIPAVVILVAAGEVWRGIALALFASLVVGSVDNFLRPRLVGRDIQMHELMIFFSTLGGLLLFGAMGFILGPILAALFVTAWEMLGAVYGRTVGEPPDGTE